MTEGLKKVLTEDRVSALKQGQKLKLSVLRLILSEIKNKEFEKRNSLSENEVYNILKSMTKRYKDAISKFKAGGRTDLVEKEEKELKVVESYLPEELSSDELHKIIDETISEVGATNMKDMGEVMKKVFEKVSGRADNKLISDIVRQRLISGI